MNTQKKGTWPAISSHLDVTLSQLHIYLALIPKVLPHKFVFRQLLVLKTQEGSRNSKSFQVNFTHVA